MQVADESVSESSSVVSHLLDENNLVLFADVILSSVKMLRSCTYFTMLINIFAWAFYFVMLPYRDGVGVIVKSYSRFFLIWHNNIVSKGIPAVIRCSNKILHFSIGGSS